MLYLALINTIYPLICTSIPKCDGQITAGDLSLTWIDRDAGTEEKNKSDRKTEIEREMKEKL